jgi:hypothetical protein
MGTNYQAIGSKRMQWMENLRLQTSSKTQHEVLKIIRIFGKEIKNSNELLSYKIYRNALITSDFSITLVWDTAQVHREGSTLAYNLKRNLSSLGLVDHSIWIEQTNSKKG